MKTWIDFDEATVFAIPLTDKLDGLQAYQGMLIEGPQGWGEFSAPRDCDDEVAGRGSGPASRQCPLRWMR